MIVCVASTKGGTAKTTSAMMLAAAAAASGRPFVVLDADPQGSATSWADRAAEEAPEGVGFDVQPANISTLRKLSASENRDIIIDTPPGQSDVILAAIKAADVTIIPTTGSGMDYERMISTFDFTAGSLSIVLQVKFAKGEKSSWDAKNAMNRQEIPVFDTVIHRRTRIEAMALSPITETFGYERVFKELLDIEERFVKAGEMAK
jgi:chromosome partitioning protein